MQQSLQMTLGANYIIDAEYSDRQNVEVTPIGGDCICYIPDTLIERIEPSEQRAERSGYV